MGTVRKRRGKNPALWGCRVMMRSVWGQAIVSPVLLAQAAVTSGLCPDPQFRRVGTLPPKVSHQLSFRRNNDSRIDPRVIDTGNRWVVASCRR